MVETFSTHRKETQRPQWRMAMRVVVSLMYANLGNRQACDLFCMPGSHAASLPRVGFLLSLQLALQILNLTAVTFFQG